MAFPNIVSYSTGGSSGTSHEIDMPNNIVAGNLIIALVVFTGSIDHISLNRELSGGEWNLLEDTGTMAMTLVVFYKLAQGGDTLFLTSNTSSDSSFIVYQVDECSTHIDTNYDSACTINANPPGVITPFGIQDYLFIVFAAVIGYDPVSQAPSNFVDLLKTNGSSIDPSCVSATRKYRTLGTYNPDSFTSTNACWLSYTICISPIRAPGFGFGSIFYNPNNL